MNAEDRFWQKVDTTGDCWVWTGSGRIYGQFFFGGTMVYAHRFSYTIHHGEIAEGVVIRHSCDNPKCVNPEHLLAGTQSDNISDMTSRGRHRNQKKSMCPRGHRYDETNTMVSSGRRYCRECKRLTTKKKEGHDAS